VLRANAIGGSASLRVRLDSLGAAVAASLVESGGDLLKDEALRLLGLSLRYSWDPNGRMIRELEVLQSLMVDQVPYLIVF
jgi:hypothetical protein